jgi:hypothetical protein
MAASRRAKDARYYAKNQLRQHIYQQLRRLMDPHRMPIYCGVKYRAERFQALVYKQLVYLSERDS